MFAYKEMDSGLDKEKIKQMEEKEFESELKLVGITGL